MPLLSKLIEVKEKQLQHTQDESSITTCIRRNGIVLAHPERAEIEEIDHKNDHYSLFCSAALRIS
jgi:hypothetical protein